MKKSLFLSGDSIEVLAPMAGITDGNFCRAMSSYGFDVVTLGGYNADKPSMEAGCRIIERGRPEFKFDDLVSHVEEQIRIVKDQNPWNGAVSVNLRTTSSEPVIKVSKLKNVDMVEINAHCRQPELVESGCGQVLLFNIPKLHDLVEEVVKNADCKVSVKVRANVAGVNDLEVAEAIENAGADYLHVDAMKPGFDHADYNIIRKIKANTDIFLVGNNSIRDLESARKMLDAGADGISIARAAIDGTIPFDLSAI
jgi:TIM-barrel protein